MPVFQARPAFPGAESQPGFSGIERPGPSFEGAEQVRRSALRGYIGGSNGPACPAAAC